MGEIGTEKEINLLDNVINKEVLSSRIKFFTDEENLNLHSGLIEPEFKDIDTISQQVFTHRDVILNEDWDSVINLYSRFIEIKADFVIIESIIKVEERLFEIRSFPIELFKHLFPLKYNDPIIIKLSTKPGSFRADIYNGKGIVDLTLFNLKDGWEDLKDANLDKPFKL